MHSFYIDKPANWSDVYRHLTAEAKRYGVIFKGNSLSGSASYQDYAGSFEVAGNRIRVVVTSKPFWAPKSAIEATVREYLRDLKAA